MRTSPLLFLEGKQHALNRSVIRRSGPGGKKEAPAMQISHEATTVIFPLFPLIEREGRSYSNKPLATLRRNILPTEPDTLQRD